MFDSVLSDRGEGPAELRGFKIIVLPFLLK